MPAGLVWLCSVSLVHFGIVVGGLEHVLVMVMTGVHSQTPSCLGAHCFNQALLSLTIEFRDIGYLLEASECVSWIFAPFFASCSLDSYQVILQIVDGACSNFLVAFILKFSFISLFYCYSWLVSSEKSILKFHTSTVFKQKFGNCFSYFSKLSHVK